MKLLVYGILTALVLVGLFFVLNAYIYSEKQAENNDPTETIAVMREGQVTGVNLEEMMVDGPARITFITDSGESHEIAVPSMGRLLCPAHEAIASPEPISVGDRIFVLGNVTEEGYIVPCEHESHYLRVEGMVRDAELGIELPYRKAPNGYVVTPLGDAMNQNPDFVRGYMFTLETDYRELQNVTEPREGAPVIALYAYRNVKNEWASVWVEKHPLESNIQLALSEPREVIVGGANGVAYRTDGLYATDTYVVTHGSYVYVFTADFIDELSPMPSDLNEILKKIVFVPEKG